MCDKLPGLDALGAVAGREIQRDVLAGWRPESLTASSGCDSSDCAYCQVLARLRRPGASPQASSACWLRSKRSRTDLAGLADATTPCSCCGSGEEDGEAPGRAKVCCGGSVPRVPSTGTLTAAAGFGVPGSSMWDHALLVEESIEEQAWRQAWHQPQQQKQQQQQQQQSQQQQQQQQSQQQQQQQQQQLQQPQQHTQQQHPQRGRPPCGSPDSHSGSRRRRRSSSSSSSTRSGGSLHTGSAPSTGHLPASLPAGSFNAWECHPRWQAPAELQQVASFLPPAQCGARRAGNSADIVCALEFEEHGWLLASAGVSKQLRVYSLASRLQHPDSPDFLQPIRCHRMPSKLSSLAWNPDAPGAVTVADYDGVVAQLDLESGHVIAEADEHGGRRVWSVSHSLQRPHLCASASEDGTVRLWGGPAMQCCLAALRPGSGSTAGTSVPACGVHLSPFDGNLAAVASADHSAYVYDLRRADQPLLQLAGHSRAVSYVRWLGPGRLATASTDASLALWQLPGPAELAGHSGEQASASGAAAAAAADGEAAAAAVPLPGGSATGLMTQPWRRLRGHRNAKNFCGLSVRPEDGLVACGSEDPAAYTYHESWASPLAAHRFAAAVSPGSSPDCSPAHCAPHQQQQQQGLFCSAVAWQPAMSRPGRAPLLASALSSGELRVLELRLPATKAAGPHSADG